MKKLLVLAIVAAFLAPATASAFEVVVPYFVDDGILEYPGGTTVLTQGWQTFVKLVNLTEDDLVCGVRYTDYNGLACTPAGNTFDLAALSGWPFRPCQDVRAEEGNKVAPGTAGTVPGVGPRPPLQAEDTTGDGEEDGDESSFALHKGALAIYIVAPRGGDSITDYPNYLDTWGGEDDGPPIAVMLETYSVIDKYANSTSSITQGVVGPKGVE